MEIRREVQETEDYVVGLRRHFHQHPESSLKEFETARRIEEELDKLLIPHERVGETGVIGYLKGKEGKVLAMRADIDALELQELNTAEYASKYEGLMHACGHDAHTAALLGAAKVLKTKESELPGSVRLFFQQAEEIGQGARQFVAGGHLQDVDGVFGLHVASGLDTGKVTVTPGPIAASCDYFKVTIHGKSGHVGKPHAAVDALYIASLSVVSLQSIVARQTDPVDPVVVGIGVLSSGTRYNIIAQEAVLEGTFRTYSQETREKTQASIERILRATVESHGATVDIEFQDFASPVINDQASAELAASVCRKIVGEDNVDTNAPKSLGADDFAELQRVVPGVYVNVGTRNPQDENSSFPHHHGHFDIDEKGLLIATELYVAYAEAFLV